MLESKNVNLRVVEKEDLPLIAEWLNNPDFFNYAPFPQRPRSELENQYDTLPSGSKWFFIERKNGSKIGFFYQAIERNTLEIGYALLPNERRKGYGTEAIKIMVDYLFLTMRTIRIQATTDVRNRASQRVLEKNGFKREGNIRKAGFVRGKWQDECLYSILREEWKTPRILARPKKRKENH